MSQNLTATRMTLLLFKKKLKMAERGHKLLKDKQDGLMKEFMEIIRDIKKLRKRLQEEFKNINRLILKVSSTMDDGFFENTLQATGTKKIELDISIKNIMSVKVPVFNFEQPKLSLQYGKLQTNTSVDVILFEFLKIVELLIGIAQIEKQAENLSYEIEKTRRRVNALEHKLIKELSTSLRFVKMKLAENERSAIVQIMAIKKMIEESEESTH